MSESDPETFPHSDIGIDRVVDADNADLGDGLDEAERARLYSAHEDADRV